MAKAPGLYPISFNAQRYFNREELADALAKEFGLLVEVEELPNSFIDFDRFCNRVVSEPIKRDPKNVYIYMAHK